MIIKHTPGPWRCEPEQASHGQSLCVVSRGEILALSQPVERYGSAEQATDLINLTAMTAVAQLLAAPPLSEQRIEQLCDMVCHLSRQPRSEGVRS